MALGALYLISASHLFSSASIWIPLVVPLLVQMPLAVFGTLGWKYRVANRERKITRKAFSHYLPQSEIEQLVANLGDLSGGRTLYSTLLYTDVEGYTGLSERMDSGKLLVLMNRYFETLSQEVKKRGGSVASIIGDAMLAFWANPQPEAGQRDRACSAALELDRAVSRFNAALKGGSGVDEFSSLPVPVQLPTRTALHSGYLSLGNVGADDHYKLTLMGDIVNTASRLDNLNKKLGTRIIASAEVVSGLEGYLTRDLGSFRMAGKSEDIAVCELLGRREDATAETLGLVAIFASALEDYRQGSWAKAVEGFRQCLNHREQDGPSRFFLEICERYNQSPPAENWDATVRLYEK